MYEGCLVLIMCGSSCLIDKVFSVDQNKDRRKLFILGLLHLLTSHPYLWGNYEFHSDGLAHHLMLIYFGTFRGIAAVALLLSVLFCTQRLQKPLWNFKFWNCLLSGFLLVCTENWEFWNVSFLECHWHKNWMCNFLYVGILCIHRQI